LNDRNRLLIMLPVLGIAAWLAFFGDKSPTGKDAGVITAVAPTRSATGESPRAASEIRAVAPIAANAGAPEKSPRNDIKLALQAPSPTNLFVSNAPPPPPPAKVVNEEDLPPPPPNFVVIGSVLKDGRFNVFLDKDNQTYVATPGAVIDGNRVDVVKSDQVQLFNLSTKTTQIIPIQGDK